MRSKILSAAFVLAMAVLLATMPARRSEAGVAGSGAFSSGTLHGSAQNVHKVHRRWRRHRRYYYRPYRYRRYHHYGYYGPRYGYYPRYYRRRYYYRPRFYGRRYWRPRRGIYIRFY